MTLEPYSANSYPWSAGMMKWSSSIENASGPFLRNRVVFVFLVPDVSLFIK